MNYLFKIDEKIISDAKTGYVRLGEIADAVIKTGRPVHAGEIIHSIPKDYVYDTETADFYCYRNKYTGKEIHILKDPKTCILDKPKGEWLFRSTENDIEVGRCSICCQRRRVDNFCSNCGASMVKSTMEEPRMGVSDHKGDGELKKYIVELTEADVKAYKMLVQIGSDASVSGHAIANAVPYVEPTGDLISREALKETLRRYPQTDDLRTTELLGFFERLIDNAQAVERPVVDSCDMNVFEPEKHMENQAKDKPLKTQVREKSDGPFFGCAGK